MKRSHLAWYGGGLAVLVGVLLVAGVPVPTTVFVVMLLACPLMMLLMGGHHDMASSHLHDGEGNGGHPGHPGDEPVEEPQQPTVIEADRHHQGSLR